MLIPNIIENIKSYKEIQLASSVGINLSPIYVDEILVEIICKLVHYNKTEVLTVQNICGDESVSLSRIVNMLEELLNIKAIIKITNAKPLSFIGSNKILINNIGHYKFTSIEDGLFENPETMTIFSNISKINPDNNKTWKNKTFLTFDIDWAHDEIIEAIYNLISSYSVGTTWFVTHNSCFINVLKMIKIVELNTSKF